MLSKAYPSALRRSPPRPPAPRVITGGVAGPVNHTVCGSISELLVAADLMARGYKPYMPVVKQRSHDIVAANGSGEIVTIEVRSGRRRADGDGYTWQSKRPEEMRSQHYAIVITGEPVIYRPDLPSP